jgi:triacylglycerol lipase
MKLVAWLSVTLSSFDPAPAPVDPAKPPVVIVHGIDGSARDMSRLARALRATGREVFTPSLTPNDGSASLEDLSAQLATFLDTHLPERTFDLIGYSMGGVVTRHYLQCRNGHTRVRRYISLSAPQNGTLTAYFRSSPGALQMRPGSDFLTRLNQDTSALQKVPTTSFWAPTDLIILPPSSAHLPGATNITKLGLGHFSFIMEKRRIQDIITILE